MLEQSEIYFLWMCYLICGSLIMVFVWKFTELFQFAFIQIPLRLLAANLIFLPLQVTEQGDVAPAFGSYLLSLILKDGAQLSVDQSAVFVFIFLAIAVVLMQFVMQRRKNMSKQDQVYRSNDLDQDALDQVSAIINQDPDEASTPDIKRVKPNRS